MLQIVLLLLSLITGSAQAQGCGPTNPNCIVPTAPMGTSNNQAASTEFVMQNGGGGIPVLPSGNIFVGNGSNAATARAMTGDCTISNVGAIVCTKTNGASFATVATSGSAADLTGTLPAARMPALGGDVTSSAGSTSVTINNGVITNAKMNISSPVNSGDVAIKSYVDGLATGIRNIGPSRYATTGALPNTPSYSDGSPCPGVSCGVGAKLTSTGNASLAVDGPNVVLNDVVLVKNQALPEQNGQYYVSNAGGGAQWVLTRCASGAGNCTQAFNTAATMLAGSYTFITEGSTLAKSSYNMTATVAAPGTDPANFVLFASDGAGVTQLNGMTGPISCAATFSCSGASIGLATPVALASGGTGAATLSGAIWGNGTSPMTAVPLTAGQLLVGQTSGPALAFTGGVVDVRWFGAIAADMSKAAVNAAAFAAAFAASKSVLCPAGFTFYTESILPPASAKYFQLDCDLIAAGTYAGSATAIVDVQNNTGGFTLRGTGTITGDVIAYPGASGVRVGSSSNVTVWGLSIVNALFGIETGFNTNLRILYNTVTNYSLGAISGGGNNTNILVQGNVIAGGLPSSAQGVAFGDLMGVTNDIFYYDNACTGAINWCFTIQAVNGSGFVVANNYAQLSHAEGITVLGRNGVISGNTISQGPTNREIGMSMTLSGATVTGNYISGSLASCMVLNNGSVFTTVTGNTCLAQPQRAIHGVALNGSGGIRITSDDISAFTDFQDYFQIFGVVGSTGANSSNAPSVCPPIPDPPGPPVTHPDIWYIKKVTPTTFDIYCHDQTTFPTMLGGVYSSGGKIGNEGWACLYDSGGGISKSFFNNSCNDFSGTMAYIYFEASPTGFSRVANNFGDPARLQAIQLATGSVTKVEDDNGMTVAQVLAMTAANGSRIYVTDGLTGQPTLTAGGTGTWAVRLNGTWRSIP